MIKLIIILILAVALLAVGYYFRYDIGFEYAVRKDAEKPWAEKPGLIKVFSPKPDEVISNPLIIEGEARGYWFFEASFSVRIYDDAGQELGVAVAQAQDEWMTTEFVPFKATLEFMAPATETGVLVLEKDNPSGLPENADELRVPIKFK